MRETTCLFGDTMSLVGILTEPEPDIPVRSQGILILNAGFVHHAGPHRLHVQLARRLAQSGFVTLCFDYSGIGNSAMRADYMPFAEASIREAREAMDFLQSSRSLDQFVTVGACWGGDNALRVCFADHRVVAAFPIDFYSVPSSRQLLRLYLPRLLSIRSWANLLAGKSWVVGRGLDAVRRLFHGRTAEEPADDGLPLDPVDHILEQMRESVARGVDLCLVFTTGSPAFDHFKASFRKDVGRMQSGGNVRVEFLDSDHIFTLLADQRRLVDLLDEWVLAVAGARPTPGGEGNGAVTKTGQ